MDDDEIPSTGNLVDNSLPEHTAYLLPERATINDADALVLAIDYMESHISRCRFQLFLGQVVEAWPDQVDCLALYMVQDESGRNAHGFRWKGYALAGPDEQGQWVPQNEQVPEFLTVLYDAAWPEDDGFWVLVAEHFGPKQALKTVTRDKALALIDEVIPASKRAKLDRHRMEGAVDDAPDADVPAPRI